MNKANKDRGPHKAKNKISDIKVKENDFEVVGQDSADERKTVIVDKDFENLEFDDKVWLWWRENKFSVIVSVLAVLAIIVIVNGHKMLKEKAISNAQVAYSECKSNADYEKFITEYSYSEIAGLAALELAAQAYNNDDFTKALDFYQKALNSLGTNELAPKAKIGEAFCQLKLGNDAEAIKILQQVSQTESISIAYKSEATLQLAILEFNKGSKETAKALLDNLAINPQAGIWANQAQAFLRANF